MRGVKSCVHTLRVVRAFSTGPGMAAGGCQVLALAVLLALFDSTLFAQSPEFGTAKKGPASTSSAMDAGDATPATASAVVGSKPETVGADTLNWNGAQPEPWEAYVKSGVIFPLGHGFLEEHIGTGWTVQVGLRQPLWRPSEMLIFGEFGGGYWANTGTQGREIVSGTFYAPNDDHSHEVNPLFNTKIAELQRFGVHAALGACYYPARLNRWAGRVVHLNVRGGLRAGGINAAYNNVLDPSVLDMTPVDPTQPASSNNPFRGVVAEHIRHGHNPELFQYFPGAKEPNLFFGVFTSVGVGITYYNASFARLRMGDVTLGAEVEFGHEWFDLGDYRRSDPGLATFSPMVSLAFSF